MVDRKKVISELEKLPIVVYSGYYQLRMTHDLRDEIVKLLKEQEAKKVVESTNMYTGLPITHCPKCGVSIDRYLYGRQHEGQTNYCPYCGQEVKW